MNKEIHPLLLEAMQVSGFVNEDGKLRISEFAEYIGVVDRTVMGWKKNISAIGEFGLRNMIEKEKMKIELEDSKKFKEYLKKFLDE